MQRRPARRNVLRAPLAALAMLALLLRILVPAPLAPQADTAAAILAALFENAPICHVGDASEPVRQPGVPPAHDCSLCPACLGGAAPLPPPPAVLVALMVAEGGPVAPQPPATGPPASPRPPFASRAPPLSA